MRCGAVQGLSNGREKYLREGTSLDQRQVTLRSVGKMCNPHPLGKPALGFYESLKIYVAEKMCRKSTEVIRYRA